MSEFTKTTTFRTINPTCGHTFAVPEVVFERLHETHDNFWCPVCRTANHFAGKTKAEKQLDQTRRELAQVRSAQRQAEHEAKQNARRYRRIRTRVQNGVCPCCNRTFQNLARHMATQHPEQPANERLRHLRTQYGLTQRDLADEVGITTNSYVSDFERGRRIPEWAERALEVWIEAQGETA